MLKPWASDGWKWKRFFCGFEFSFSWRDSNSWMGRFGGGWQWKIGIQSGGSSILLSLLIAELTISKVTPKVTNDATTPASRTGVV